MDSLDEGVDGLYSNSFGVAVLVMGGQTKQKSKFLLFRYLRHQDQIN
jgi:hypothetical protein